MSQDQQGSEEASGDKPQDTPQIRQYFLQLYEDLRRLAERKLAGEEPGQTLQATALVHETYMRLIDAGTDRSVNDKQHFYALAAETMRHVLIDNARRRKSLKRGGGRKRTALVDDPVAPSANPANLLALDDAIVRLAEVDPESARIIQLRYFGGHTLAETAEMMGISRTQAYRLWSFARAWLLNDFRQNDG